MAPAVEGGPNSARHRRPVTAMPGHAVALMEGGWGAMDDRMWVTPRVERGRIRSDLLDLGKVVGLRLSRTCLSRFSDDMDRHA